MADNDHICIYRQFFEEFAKTSEIEVSRPMRVNPYDLSVDELVGEVMQSCVNYLVERKCPRSLVVPLTKIVVEEFINEAKKEPEEVNTPLKLNRKTHDKISEVCLRFTDNEQLSSLPAPVEETYYSTHSTKHTRRRMEDRLICLPRFNSLHNIQSNSEAGYYGIFDGHSGVNAACYAASHLHQFLAESEYYPDNPVLAFRQAFEKTECKYNSKDENSGTTVLAILYQPTEKKLTVAWVGDSQAMLVNEDSFIMLIDPHKPDRADERRRIEALGGWIVRPQGVYRVNGGLAISRAIGDKELKPYVSAEPEIRVVNLTGSEHFIVMGCDGLWDVVEPQQVIETVYFEVKKNQGQVDSVARRLVDLAKENNSTDNISVIVIFLTDPAEISNRPVDVNGHRPKILHQDGVIMEANFPANDKSPFNDPGMNGIYETNGNHFRDHLQNESDEDFGPETDVDAVDDVLTSTKNLNPFAKECWQKKTDEDSDKLIEVPVGIEGEIIKFSEDFTESAKLTEDKNLSQINNNEIGSDKFPVDNINPFETADTNNTSSESFNISHNFTEDNNKYVDEINSRKEEVESLMPPKILDQTFVLKNNSEEEKNFQEIAEDGSFGFAGDDITSLKQTVFDATPENANIFFNEEVKPEVEESLNNFPLESETQIESVPESNREFYLQENENDNSQSNEINTTLNNLDEFRELNLKTNEEEIDLMEQTQNVPLEASGNPPELYSVIDKVEAEKASYDSFQGKNVAAEAGDEPSSELLSPSALVLDGELKDETVAESGGEVEDSEDDEWNYIKVESGTQQAVPVNSKVDELISSPNELLETEKPTMNSPLNPEADEFIPVSAMSSNNEYNMNVTPKKAIPSGLNDIIASSPNWSNMNKVNLPEESAFLTEIKSRPSNIFENSESPQQEEFCEKNNNVNDSLNCIPSAEVDKENELVNFIEKEPHGIDLASDMTSSFIDPSTMSSDVETSKETVGYVNSQLENSFIEKPELFFNEHPPKVQELAPKEHSPEMPDLLSPVPAQEVSLAPPSVDILKMSSVEPSTIVSEPIALDTSDIPLQDSEVIEKKQDEVTQVTSPSKNEQFFEKEIPSESFSESPKDEGSNEVKAAVGVAAVATATAVVAEAAAAKKDTKKNVSTATSATKTKAAPTSKAPLNGTRTPSGPKKSTTLNQTAKPPVSGRTTGTTPALSSKATAPRTSTITKAPPKSSAPVSSSLSKAPARARPLSAVSTAPKASPPPKTTVTASPRKSPVTANTASATAALKPVNKTTGLSATLKSKPKIPSASVEKRPTSAVNGEIKTTVKRTEITTKKFGDSTATMITTRMSLSARSSTAPSKPMTLKTTATTTRTVPAKPKTTMSTTTTSTLLSPSSKVSSTGRKSTISADKQAKEAANRLASKTAPKPNGVAQRSAASVASKTRKTLMSATTSPSSVKNHDKTESKAEKILDEKVEKIQSENMALMVDNNTDINKINSLVSE